MVYFQIISQSFITRFESNGPLPGPITISSDSLDEAIIDVVSNFILYIGVQYISFSYYGFLSWIFLIDSLTIIK